jgi:hypothetical protein
MKQKIAFISLVNLGDHDVGILRSVTLGKGTKSDPRRLDCLPEVFHFIIGVLQYLVRHM